MHTNPIKVYYMNQYRNSTTALLFFAVLLASLPFTLKAQAPLADSILQEVTLPGAVSYAIQRQPLVQQSLLDESITAQQVKSKLADWYPQVNFNYSLQHNFLVPTSVIGGNPIKLGVNNTSAAQFSASQYLFNRDLLLAKRTKDDVMQQARLTTSSNKIDLAVAVTKAFYDVLSTMQQLKIAQTNIARIERSLKDAYNQYQAGIADKTDYKRATITLNNTKAAQKSNEVLLEAKLAYLKSLMNYPEKEDLHIVFDSLQMENEIGLDTLQVADYKSRIEYSSLQTRQRLLAANVQYNKWSYLPAVSANAAYNFNYQNNQFGKLYSNNFPNSYAGITLAVPIFQGGKRKANITAASLELQRSELDMVNLKNDVNAGYAQALAVYKSNLAGYLALKENVALANEVYEVIQLQYRSGIKSYLEVIIAETDLRTAQINYYTALYQLLASKTDVEKALGQVKY